jgi:hypothetical protein
MEQMLVTQYTYPSLLASPSTLTFVDQFAFWPTGSTTAAIITILDRISRLPVANPYVVVIAIDLIKVFDTLWHATLVEQLSVHNLPENVRMQLATQLSQSAVVLYYIPRRNIILPQSLS